VTDLPARAAIDTNILLYTEGLLIADADKAKMAASTDLMDRLYAGDCQIVIPVQVLCELHNGLRRKLGLSPLEAAERVARLIRYCETEATTAEVFAAGIELAASHKLQTYDAIILAAASNAGCAVLYSEDMQHGFAWGGVKVINSFL
jgi:predicted nucleic acid-binding protein